MAPFAPPEEIRALPRQYGIFEGSVLNCTHTSGLGTCLAFPPPPWYTLDSLAGWDVGILGVNRNQEREPMKVFVTNQPYMLYETVEVLRRYVNGDTPEDLPVSPGDGGACRLCLSGPGPQRNMDFIFLSKPSDPGQSQPEHLPGFLHCLQQF